MPSTAPPQVAGGIGKMSGGSDIGKTEIGRQEDLARFTLDRLRFSGPGDPIAALVLRGVHRADRGMIAGMWCVTEGGPVGIDMARPRYEQGQAASAFLTSV